MRRIPRAVALAAAVTLLVAACGGGGSETTPEAGDTAAPDAASGTAPPERADADLVIWTDNLKVDAVQTIADQFAEANGISVAVQVVAADLQTAFVTANTAGNGPDVFTGAHDWIGNLVQNGAIDPLQLTADQLSGYSPVAVKATTYSDTLYALPYGIEALALYRNTDLAPEEPASLDAAFAAGQAAVDAGKAESAFNVPQGTTGDPYHLEPMYTSMGGYLFGQTPEGDYNPSDLGVGKEGSVAAAQKIHDLGEAGSGILKRSISNDNAIPLFAEGKAPFLVSGPWAINQIEEAGINYAVQPIPGFEGQKPAQPFAGVQAFYVASKGKNKAFAQEFVSNTVNTEEAMTQLFEGAKIPPTMTAVRQAVAAENPEIEVFATAAETAAPMPAIPAMAAIWGPLGQAYAAIIGGADPTSTIQTAGQTIASEIG
jgi:arabinogalactan oligomer/maltooligosaccharide transport system substrate-binding protein